MIETTSRNSLWFLRQPRGLENTGQQGFLSWFLLGHSHLRCRRPHTTSPAMPRTPRCSNITSYAGDSSVLGHRQLRRGLLGARTSPATPRIPWCSDIASYVEDSSVFGHRQRLLGARTSPATLGTPQCSDIHQLRRGVLGARTSSATLGSPQCSDSSCKHHQLS